MGGAVKEVLNTKEAGRSERRVGVASDNAELLDRVAVDEAADEREPEHAQVERE